MNNFYFYSESNRNKVAFVVSRQWNIEAYWTHIGCEVNVTAEPTTVSAAYALVEEVESMTAMYRDHLGEHAGITGIEFVLIAEYDLGGLSASADKVRQAAGHEEVQVVVRDGVLKVRYIGRSSKVEDIENVIKVALEGIKNIGQLADRWIVCPEYNPEWKEE